VQGGPYHGHDKILQIPGSRHHRNGEDAHNGDEVADSREMVRYTADLISVKHEYPKREGLKGYVHGEANSWRNGSP